MSTIWNYMWGIFIGFAFAVVFVHDLTLWSEVATILLVGIIGGAGNWLINEFLHREEE